MFTRDSFKFYDARNEQATEMRLTSIDFFCRRKEIYKKLMAGTLGNQLFNRYMTAFIVPALINIHNFDLV